MVFCPMIFLRYDTVDMILCACFLSVKLFCALSHIQYTVKESVVKLMVSQGSCNE